MKIKIAENAADDLICGYNFYEMQEPGVGDYFLDSLLSSIDSLVLYYGIQQKFHRKYYRMLSRVFPYAIYYSYDSETIYIAAVQDVRRNPSFNSKRLES
jgi:hypothetical protein